MPLMPSSASLDGLGDNMSQQSLFYLCQRTCVRTLFFLFSGSFSYQSVPTLSDLGPKGKPQSPFCWASRLAARHAGLRSYLVYLRILSHWTEKCQKFFCLLILQNALLPSKAGPVSAIPSWLWWAVQQDILPPVLYRTSHGGSHVLLKRWLAWTFSGRLEHWTLFSWVSLELASREAKSPSCVGHNGAGRDLH